MRVQPHLPSNPLVATTMASFGSARWACSAANRPAPPEPRIRISVVARSIAMTPHCTAFPTREPYSQWLTSFGNLKSSVWHLNHFRQPPKPTYPAHKCQEQDDPKKFLYPCSSDLPGINERYADRLNIAGVARNQGEAVADCRGRNQCIDHRTTPGG